MVFLFFGADLVALFRPEPEVLRTGSTLLLIAAGFQIFDGLAMVKTGALNGAGDTRYVMLVSVLAYSSISDIGTWASITCDDPWASPEPTRPRRLERSPMTSPTYWSGTET